MTDKKPTLYEELFGDDEAWARSRARTRLNEACEVVVNHLNLYQGYEWRDAFHVIEELSPAWTLEEVDEILTKNVPDKIREDARRLLTERGAVKKNDGGIENPSL